ncbi:MAG TPA: hypothetical protein VHC67_02265 [Gaiellaceae bacterium]|jgi:hypothetical protein|nr:hypothetical protein [Gaiellaceae bacterium]
MRTLAGSLLAGAAVAAALWIHSGLKADRFAVDTGITPSGRYVGTQRSQQVANRGVFSVKKTLFVTAHRRASWQDPAAAFVAVAGVGAALGLAFRRI